MKLSKPDVTLFYKLMNAIQSFVNKKYQVMPEIDSLPEYLELTTDEKRKVRDKLYEKIEIIDDFVRENPYNLPQQELNIVKGWKNYVSGSFYIERYLKKYTVLLSEDSKVYGVLALTESFEEMLEFLSPPILIKTVLLPFKGKVIYDGLFNFYNVYFGGGLRRHLKEIYMKAKYQDKIIETFDKKTAGSAKVKPKKPSVDYAPELKKMAKAAKKMKGGGGQPPIVSPAFSLLKASIELAETSVSNPDDHARLDNCLMKIRRAFTTFSRTFSRYEDY